MKTDTDLDRLTAEWLEQGSRQMPTRVLDNAMSAIAGTRQLSPARPRWEMRLLRFAGLAAGAAAVVAVIAFGPAAIERIRGLFPEASSGPVGASPTSSPAVAADPFLGVWQATDTDGSSMRLTISGAPGAIEVQLTDTFATVCQLQGAPTFAYTGQGTGVLGAGTLRITWTNEQCADFHLSPGPSRLMGYDAASDTLVGMEVAWDRVKAP